MGDSLLSAETTSELSDNSAINTEGVQPIQAASEILPIDEEHSPNGKVTPLLELAIALFDRTQPLHDLGGDSRRLLEEAARLHRYGLPHAKKKPHKAAVALVRAKVEQPLDEADESLLAAILAFHQGKLRRKDFSKLDLSPTQERQALTIAALLRIAVGLSGSGETSIERVRVGEEGMWIVVSGSQAAADAAVAQQCTHLWTRIGYPEVEVLETAEAAIRMLPLPEETESIGLDPDDLLSEAGRKTLRFHFARMLGQEAGTREGVDIEALHRMRVASRRLRAAFDVYADAFEPGALKWYRKGLRLAGQTLGKVRDLDVFMEKAGSYAAELTEERRQGMAAVLAVWEAEREAAQRDLIEYLDGKEWAEFKRKFNIFINTPGAGARLFPENQPVPRTARELVPALIYERLAAVRAYAPLIAANPPVETLHMLRIEFKKLRYTVEYFEEILGKRARDVINEIKLLQDHLGDLQDAEVASALLADLYAKMQASAETPADVLAELAGYLAYRQTERGRLIAGFPMVWRRHFDRVGFRRMLATTISRL